MLAFPRWRVILVAIVSVLAFLFTFPNLISPELRKQLPPFVPHSTVNLRVRPAV